MQANRYFIHGFRSVGWLDRILPESMEEKLMRYTSEEQAEEEKDNDWIVFLKKYFLRTEFLDKYGTEIVEMLFKELTREEDLEISRLDGYDEGQRIGFTKGEKSGAAAKVCQSPSRISSPLKSGL